MRYTSIIGSQDDNVEYRSVKPKYYPCPQCGKTGKRKRVITRRIAHVAAVGCRSWIVADVGLYKARCVCCKYFHTPPDLVVCDQEVHNRTSVTPHKACEEVSNMEMWNHFEPRDVRVSLPRRADE